MYNEKVLDHFTNPRNVGDLPDADAVGVAANPQCGDTMKLYLKVSEGIVTEAKWQARGCSAAIATSSMASEMVKGRSITEAGKLTNKAIADMLGGLPPAKVHCSVLAADAIREAIRDYEDRKSRSGH